MKVYYNFEGFSSKLYCPQGGKMTVLTLSLDSMYNYSVQNATYTYTQVSNKNLLSDQH